MPLQNTNKTVADAQNAVQNKEYVLILGAGLMQRPAIEAARELGFAAVVADANPKAVCVPFADIFAPVDLKDREGLLKLAQSFGLNLKAVFTAGTDFSSSVSFVAQKCGLVSHTLEAAENASDKVRMRKCFLEADVPSPDFMQIEQSAIQDFLSSKECAELEFPKVVKPVDNMGARGCRLARDRSELEHSLYEAAKNSRSGRVIVEDYMEGPEFSIDALVHNGTFTVTGFADRHIFYKPYFIEMGHTMPSCVPPQIKLELIEAFAKGAAALGLTEGAAKADIKYTKNGPMIGEIAGRLSGGYMSGWTYPYASSLNLTEQALLIAAGKEPVELVKKRKPLGITSGNFVLYEAECDKTSAERAFISIPGTVSSVYGTDTASSSPFVKNLLFRCGEGSDAEFPRNNVEKCGNAISCSKSAVLARSAAEYAVSQLTLRLKPHSEKTDSFLFGQDLPFEKNFPPPAFACTEKTEAALDRLFCESPVFKAGTKASVYFSQIIPLMEGQYDWNKKSFAVTLEQYDQLCPNHQDIEGRSFSRALFKGGIQGMLYVSDGVSYES